MPTPTPSRKVELWGDLLRETSETSIPLRSLCLPWGEANQAPEDSA